MGKLIEGKPRDEWFREIRRFLCDFGYSPPGWKSAFAALSVLAHERVTSRESAVKLYVALKANEAIYHIDDFEKLFVVKLGEIKKAKASLRKRSQYQKIDLHSLSEEYAQLVEAKSYDEN